MKLNEALMTLEKNKKIGILYNKRTGEIIRIDNDEFALPYGLTPYQWVNIEDDTDGWNLGMWKGD